MKDESEMPPAGNSFAFWIDSSFRLHPSSFLGSEGHSGGTQPHNLHDQAVDASAKNMRRTRLDLICTIVMLPLLSRRHFIP
jgi:hypothetical protein